VNVSVSDVRAPMRMGSVETAEVGGALVSAGVVAVVSEVVSGVVAVVLVGAEAADVAAGSSAAQAAMTSVMTVKIGSHPAFARFVDILTSRQRAALPVVIAVDSPPGGSARANSLRA
jgi:hypothetical protein